MTNRQYVKNHYPNAILDYRCMPVNTMAPVTWYEVRTDNWGNDSRLIAKGKTRNQAWKNAKNKINKILKPT